MNLLLNIIRDTIQITLLVLGMMIAVDLLNVWTRGKIGLILNGRGKSRQYFVAPLIGTMPGCLGAFTNASLYMHGMISFGALVGAMAAASGDEAFVMLAMFPKTAVVLFGILFGIGVLTGWLTDRLVRTFNIRTCTDCSAKIHHPNHEGFRHYITDHVWEHIIKRHIWKTALWTLGALLVVQLGLQYWNLESLASQYTLTLIFISAVIGLIPESGPHLIFITLYAKGIIPFSVLLTSSIVQDGHGMLPMLAFSLRDSMRIKGFNLMFGTLLGLLFYSIGY